MRIVGCVLLLLGLVSCSGGDESGTDQVARAHKQDAKAVGVSLATALKKSDRTLQDLGGIDGLSELGAKPCLVAAREMAKDDQKRLEKMAGWCVDSFVAAYFGE